MFDLAEANCFVLVQMYRVSLFEFREDSSYKIRLTQRFSVEKTKEIKRTVPICSSLAKIRLRQVRLMRSLLFSYGGSVSTVDGSDGR